MHDQLRTARARAARAARRPGSLRRTWARHPRLGLAIKAAIAVSIAWVLVQFVPGPVGDYPYYAPLGAVLATSTTLAGSARESGQSVAAIVLGAAIALGAQAVFDANALALAVVVALAILLAGWHRLGSARSWLPTSAMFVLILGGDNPTPYVLGFAGLTCMGAVVGLAVTAAFPPLPLAPAEEKLGRLRDGLAGQLEDLADGLRQPHPPTQDDWRRRTHTLDPMLAQMREAVQQADEARQGNRRARKYREEADRQYAQARGLEHLTLLVEDLTALVAATESADNDVVALGPTLRPPAARTLACLAHALREVEGSTTTPEAAREVDEALAEFAAALRRVRADTDDDLFAASNIAESVSRSLAAIRPVETTAD